MSHEGENFATLIKFFHSDNLEGLEQEVNRWMLQDTIHIITTSLTVKSMDTNDEFRDPFFYLAVTYMEIPTMISFKAPEPINGSEL